MSDLAFSRRTEPGRASARLLDTLARPPRHQVPGIQPEGFKADTRFGGKAQAPAPHEPDPAAAAPESESGDPVAEAFSHGFAVGHEQASHEARRRAETDDAAREKLSLAFARLDEVLEEELRLRLRDTVSALCESAIAPLAIDPDALLRRVSVAVSMLTRAEDERLVRLHPEDLRLVSSRLSAEWQVQPDTTLERGTVRVETATGGVEDGPANWRRAIAEALHRC